jgi:hypothetical protein
MKNKNGQIVWAALMWLFGCAILGQISTVAATLQWTPNPDAERISFYTVYAESSGETLSHAIQEGTSFNLDTLPTGVSYTLFVTATSIDGLESERSAGIVYSLAPISAPSITSQPVSTVLATGSTLTLSVTASSSSTISYQWFKDAQLLVGQTSSSLTATNVSILEAGSYKVVVANTSGSVESSVALVTIQRPPAIYVQPQPSSVPAGTSVVLSVGAEGTDLGYQWFKNNQPLSGKTNSTLAISSVTALDQASYRATASNLVGTATSDSVALTVLFPPTIVNAPVSTNLAVGGTIQLAVSVSGTQPIIFQWTRNDQMIPNATNSALVIPSATVNDSGSYRIRVSNVVNTITSAPATVSVMNPPTIVIQPVSKDVLSDGVLNLAVTAQGSAVLSYQWFRNGSPISGATTETFSVSGVTSANSGEYTVRVSNLVGSVTSQAATLRVLPHIVILAQPASTNLQIGAQLALAVQASGPSPLSYQWFLGTLALSGATNSTFQIAGVSSNHAGIYTVQISSSLETITSAPAQVVVAQMPLPPAIVSHPQSAQLVLGASLSLSVSATGTDLTYQWLKNDVAIPGAVNPAYSLSSFTSSDQGSYRVRVSNSLNSVTSNPAVISLVVPPSITVPPANTNLATGGTILLEVTASGTQPFTFAWFKNGSLLSGATNASLAIASATTNHSGSYQARVSNAANTAMSAPATVSVTNPPKIVTHPKNTKILKGSRLNLPVIAEGADLSYQWYLNGTAISDATNSTFDTAEPISGSYTVMVANSVGSVTSDPASVEILLPIAILQNPGNTNLTTGGQLALSVQATGPAPLSYQWYRNNAKLNGKTSPDLLISNAAASDSGSYTVQIASAVQNVVSGPAQVTITDGQISGATLSMIPASDGSMRISGIAPANTTYEIQRTETLTQPRWRRVQNVSSKSDGTFEVTISATTANSGFIRTVRR